MEKDNLFHLINQTSRQISKSFNEQLVPSGLYMAQWAIIRYLVNNGPSTQKQMCDYLNVEAPTMTRTLTRMEELGLIHKVESSDKRANIIHLTEHALGKFPIWEEEVKAYEKPVFEELSHDELVTTINVLNKIRRKLE